MESSRTSGQSPATARSFFPALRNLAVISFVLLAGATALRQPPWIAALGGVAPLIWYHLAYLAPRARTGLSQAAIDSVYYFGFLVTIAALGVSALSLALGHGKESMDTIAYQFGLGLLATGYAVFARMHLTSISTWLDEQSPEVVLDRYLSRTQELVTNVEMASVQFATLSSNLMSKTEEVTRRSSDAAEKSMLEMARLFDEQLRSTLASGNHGLSELRSLISETSFREEREALARSIKVTLDSVLHLNKALLELTNQFVESARSTDNARGRSDALSQSIEQLSNRIDMVAGDNGTLVRTVDTFDSVQARAVKATTALDGVVEELIEVGGSLGGVGTTFKSLKALTSKAQGQLDALVSSSELLDKATERIANSAQKTDALASGVDRVVAGLPQLGEGVDALRARMEELSVTTGAVEQQMQTVPRPTEAAVDVVNELRDAVQKLQTVLASAGTEAKGLAGITASTVQGLENAERLANTVGNLKEGTSTVNELLNSIVESANRATTSLSTSTQQMERTVAAASRALEHDVETSSRAATLFTQSLTDVAQGIINETRKVQPV